MILSRRPPEQVAGRDRDGRFAVAERRVAGRNQVQLWLGVKVPWPPRRRDVMPDVASRAAGDRKRLVQRLRHRGRLAEIAGFRPGGRPGSFLFPTKCEVGAGPPLTAQGGKTAPIVARCCTIGFCEPTSAPRHYWKRCIACRRSKPGALAACGARG